VNGERKKHEGLAHKRGVATALRVCGISLLLVALAIVIAGVTDGARGDRTSAIYLIATAFVCVVMAWLSLHASNQLRRLGGERTRH
jgi:small neutral amino acid transporter SnatA (MarC family)